MTELVLREIKQGDSVNSFSGGSAEFAPLKTFLQKDAINFHDKNIAKTYVIATNISNKIIAYITLTNNEVALEHNDKPIDCKRAKIYAAYLAIKIARFAVDSKHRGKGYGKALLDYSIIMVKDRIMPYVGCRYLVVDSKQNAIKFYENAGFKLIDTEKNKSGDVPLMFLDLNGI